MSAFLRELSEGTTPLQARKFLRNFQEDKNVIDAVVISVLNVGSTLKS